MIERHYRPEPTPDFIQPLLLGVVTQGKVEKRYYAGDCRGQFERPGVKVDFYLDEYGKWVTEVVQTI